MTYGIITLTCNDPLYNIFDDMKREYLNNRNILNTFVYNNANADINIRESDSVYLSNLTGTAGIYTMFDKFIATIQNNPIWKSLDYVLRVNSSKFLNIPILEEYIRTKLTAEKCYAGACTMPMGPNDFISGTCMVFSRDVIELLSQTTNKHENNRREDDLIMFDYMKRLNVPRTNIPMHWYDTNIIPSEEEITNIMKTYPLIRIKNMKDRHSIDTAIWKLLINKG